jgi:hypothetical protein
MCLIVIDELSFENRTGGDIILYSLEITKNSSDG